MDLETPKKQNGSKSTNHELQTMTFKTLASKQVFPKRSANRKTQELQNAQRDTTNFAINGTSPCST